jgi:hypothetical protein
MTSKFKQIFYAIAACIALAACSGKDGDPGPQGEQGETGATGATGATGPAGKSEFFKLGSVEGTVSGKRKDGTVFNETFKYEYTSDSLQAFFPEEGVNTLSIARYSNPAADAEFTLNLQMAQGDALTPAAPTYSSYFRFIKEVDNNTLFRILAQPYFESTEAVTRELSVDQNLVYNFNTDGSTATIYYYQTTHNSVNAYLFNAYVTNKTYYVYYNVATGALMDLYISNNNGGQTITSGPLFDLYNKLKFKPSATLDMPVFYDANTGADLSESIPDVPADQLTITNYNRNASTGIITFDFELKISGYISNVYYRQNSTGHDLTIKGKYNSGGKVYTSTVGRVRG